MVATRRASLSSDNSYSFYQNLSSWQIEANSYLFYVHVLLLLQVIDFTEFEEIFKLGTGGLLGSDDGTPKTMKRRKPEAISLLEANRLRNVGE